MSAPPFCPLGSFHYQDPFTLGISLTYWEAPGATVGSWDSLNNRVYFGPGSIKLGFLPSLTGNMGIGAKIGRISVGSSGGTYYFYNAITLSNPSMLFGMFYDQSNVFGGGANKFWHRLDFNGVLGIYQSLDAFQGASGVNHFYEIKRIGTTHRFYIDGNLVYTGTAAATNTSAGFYTSGGGSHQSYGDDFYAYCSSGLPNQCLGEKPTYHRIAPNGTQKASHFKIYEGRFSTNQIKELHNQIK